MWGGLGAVGRLGSSSSLGSSRVPRKKHRNGAKRSLEAQRRDRDETIAALESASRLELKETSDLRNTLEELRAAYQIEIGNRDAEIERLKNQQDDLEQRIEAHNRDILNDSLRIEFEALIRETTPKQEVTSAALTEQDEVDALDDDKKDLLIPRTYLHRLQNKLGKAMHRMHVLQHQTEIVEQQRNEAVESLEQELELFREERIKSEAELKSRLESLEHDKKVEVEMVFARLEVKDTSIESLEATIEELKRKALEQEEKRKMVIKEDVETVGDGGKMRESDGGSLKWAGQKIQTMMAMSKLRGQIDSLEKDKIRMEQQHKKETDKQLKQMRLLEEANKKKQDKIEEYMERFGNIDEIDKRRTENEDENPFIAPGLGSLMSRLASATRGMEEELKESLNKKEAVLKRLNSDDEIDESRTGQTEELMEEDEFGHDEPIIRKV